MEIASAPRLKYDGAAEARHLALREDFLIDPDVVFLNHGSFGACPRPVFERYQAWQRELERQPVEFLGRRQHQLSWTFVTEHGQARVVVQKLPVPMDDPEAVVEAVWAGVTPKTRVLFLSHVTSSTAVTLPIEPLIRRAREAGIWTVVDGAHAPGQIDVDLTALDVDFYGGNCHKWMSSAKGAGFLYVRPEMQHLIDPLVVSWGWRPTEHWSTPFVDAMQRQATHDISAYLSVPSAIAYQQEHDWPSVRRECHELVRLARQSMTAITGVEPLVLDDPRWFAQMATLPLPSGTDGETLKRRLYDEYRIEIPETRWGDVPCLRISVQGYNTRADVDRLTAAVADLLPSVGGH